MKPQASGAGTKVDGFKACPKCGAAWPDRERFLEDPDVPAKGYQVNFGELELGFFLFDHAPCRTTLAVHAREFLDLYNGPVFRERRTRTEDCPEYCLHPEEMRPCLAKCECAYVREVLHAVRTWKKRGP